MITPDIGEILERYPNAGRETLIPILQEVQDRHGYLSPEAIFEVGRHLKLLPSKVYGVASFYDQFRFKPAGKFHLQVCRGANCHLHGSEGLAALLQQELKIAPGETTVDGLFSLELVSCMGACGLAPVLCVNGEYFTRISAGQLKGIISDCRRRERAAGGKNVECPVDER